ncbi:hypothetical protein PGT21_034220 [Puccinia graminis f. sp. tritici]|uniref:Store-operated calcium entry-associated regulatory factor n=2 Tax=Puccinia graminis f. sp. tritici TaxID=56615 RepID=E3L1M0_PUCGT|nr:uncharacterized protein PGTG_16032 [Puccinia graminis f. sp. tritici CRL 75-36-700-3]EFP90445.2 hypothetical protein PGTG_16032 [Puccinia graminis f. sp. tritici CRL 75-36-700-3]KAA1101961.1 hypothetical protein PGT21_034220 [Puccinia graminis f. sp. tritici]KAA1133828.1 hypothetical protein PGTUg99_023318 [Puccinia graminis f. sp. tritici]
MAFNSKVLLSDISTLTFFDGEQTTFRRTSPVDQLVCRGPGCKVFRPEVIQCYNKGGLGTDVNWKCEADLPAKLKLGRVEVGCEGWSNSQDPYVLKGSCALTYTLNLDTYSKYNTSAESSPAVAWVYWMVVILIAFLFAYPYIRSFLVRFLPWLDPILADSSSGGDGGGPPPPYMPDQPPPKSAPSTSQPWWSPFLSGVVSGTVTHLLRGADTRASDRPSTGFATAPSYGRSHPTYRGQGSSSDMDDSSNLGPIQTSTGFGGTNNR